VLHGPKQCGLAASVDAGHRAIMVRTMCTRSIELEDVDCWLHAPAAEAAR